MYLNPKQIRENNDKDICIYTKRVSVKDFPYVNDWMFTVWHNGKRSYKINRYNNFDNLPKDGDRCEICGREILIVDET